LQACQKPLRGSTIYGMTDPSAAEISISASNEAGRDTAHQDARYLEAIQLYGSALMRLARGYETEPDRRQDLLQDIHIALWRSRQDLLQDIHIALWRSFAIFDNRCSLRTWVYRVAHITATKHIVANKRVRLTEMFTLDDVPEPTDEHDTVRALDQSESLERLLRTIERLKPLDRQVILLYLEDFSAEAIGEVVGLSAENIATKVYRIKKLLSVMFHARDAS
jgi:RNA polymerase sigma-70 factor, ECF subfamily